MQSPYYLLCIYVPKNYVYTYIYIRNEIDVTQIEGK